MTLYDDLGGAVVLDDVVARFHQRLLDDPRIGHLFSPDRTADLLERQHRYFTALLGGRPGYDAGALGAAHRDVPISDEQVAIAVAHLGDCMIAASVGEEVAERVVAVVSRVWWARDW